MTILKKAKFNEELKSIVYFIAKDSKDRAKKFKNMLIKKVENISFMPFKHRKSIFFDDINIRDLIFKGYIIVYKIDLSNNTIIILGIKKYTNEFI